MFNWLLIKLLRKFADRQVSRIYSDKRSELVDCANVIIRHIEERHND